MTTRIADISTFAARQWRQLPAEHPIKLEMSFWAFKDCIDLTINNTKVPYESYKHRELVREHINME
jgi:hypothetical protein